MTSGHAIGPFGPPFHPSGAPAGVEDAPARRAVGQPVEQPAHAALVHPDREQVVASLVDPAV